MKKYLVLLICLFLTVCLYSYNIETSYGDYELVVPEDMTIEEAYCEMAKLYLEERFDHEELIKKSEELTKQVDSYITANKELREEYNALNEKYKELVELYQIDTKKKIIRPFAGFELSLLEDNNMGGGLTAGAIFQDKIKFSVTAAYPLRVSIGIGYIFN